MRNVFAGTKVTSIVTVMLLAAFISGCATTTPAQREAKNKQQLEETQKNFAWWGKTGAMPAPVKDAQRGGYWWWPTKPAAQQIKVWGNGGYVYLRTIFDYQSDELPPAQPKEMRPSLLIKKIIKNVKIYFDFDKSKLREDAKDVLEDAVTVLNKSPETAILISGNCDVRGSEKYNDKLGRKRADSVKKYFIEQGIPEERVKIVSRGKLDAVAPVTDLKGMAKDRNAQFMVAEVQEVMLPTPEQGQTTPVEVQVPPDAKVEEGKYVTETQEEVTNQIKVETKEYTIKKGDTLWTIAQAQLGSGHRWKTLAEMNKDTVRNPNKLKPGQTIIIPVE